MQIDQDPGAYRVKGPDGEWRYRVNKPLCRWLGLAALGFAAYFVIASGGETSAIALFVGLLSLCAGALLTLSLKSTDW